MGTLSLISPNGKNLVAQANALIRSRYKTTRNEELLLKSMMSLIDPKDEEFLTFTATVKDLAQILQLHPSTAVREFDKITTRLMSRVLKVENGEGWEKFQWVSKASLKNGIVSLKFHDELKPYLLALRESGHFTQYRLEDVVWFRSSHTSRIYELLVEAHNKKQRFFTYDVIEFRQRMLGDKSKAYPLFKDFRKYVINVAQDELSQKDENGLYKSKLNFELLTHRTARKITEVEFRIIVQKTASKPEKAAPKKEEDTDKTPAMEALEQHGIKGSTAQKYLDQQGEDEILRCVALLKDASNSGRIKTSESGYLLRLLEERAGQPTQAEKEKKQKDAQKEEAFRTASAEELKKDLINKISSEFFRKERQTWIASLSPEEAEKMLKESRQGLGFSSSMITTLESPLVMDFVKSKIDDYENKKELYIQENLKN